MQQTAAATGAHSKLGVHWPWPPLVRLAGAVYYPLDRTFPQVPRLPRALPWGQLAITRIVRLLLLHNFPTHRKTGARCIRPIGHRPHCRITIRLRQGCNPQVIPHGSGKVRLSQGSSGYSLIEQLPTHRNMDLGVLYKTWPM
jgi:hypothetical protein